MICIKLIVHNTKQQWQLPMVSQQSKITTHYFNDALNKSFQTVYAFVLLVITDAISAP